VLDERLRVILIGGTSNVGKSTVAQLIAGRLGWGYASTDRLARYPGRPWATPPDVVKPHVIEHYLSSDDAQLIAGQLAHYQNMWPMVEALVRRHAEDDPTAGRLVLEGSGVWPENVADLHMPNAAAVWLTASPALIEARIRNESHYDEADAPGKLLIDRFVVRSVGYDVEMMRLIRQLQLPHIEVTPETTPDALADICIERMRVIG
jgi:2-phosphoglycerate kinase